MNGRICEKKEGRWRGGEKKRKENKEEKWEEKGWKRLIADTSIMHLYSLINIKCARQCRIKQSPELPICGLVFRGKKNGGKKNLISCRNFLLKLCGQSLPGIFFGFFFRLSRVNISTIFFSYYVFFKDFAIRFFFGFAIFYFSKKNCS